MRNRTPKTIWKANDIGELRDHLKKAEVDVPLRSEGRTAEHTERYAIAHLLSSLSPDYFKFPVEVIYQDRPDFLLRTRGLDIGIEHIEVVPQTEAYMARLREEGHGPEMHFIRQAVIDEPVRSRKETIEEIESDEEGDGWAGDSAEHEWAEAVAHHIKKKMERVDQPGFESFDETWLLMYDNWPLPSVDPRKAAHFLLATAGIADALKRFRRIFIMDGQRIWEFSWGATFHVLKHPADA